jgi:voltage-gated sodium channel
MLARFVAHPWTERVIVALILLNAVTLGLETFPDVMERYGSLLHAIDRVLLAIFVTELLVRIGVKRLAFFRDPWSLFDFLVIGIALLPATGSLSVLRSLRILRALRLITVVPSLRRVVAGLISALPGMASIMLLLGLIFFVFAVMASKLYGESKPELFGHLGLAAYTLFQVMTFDDWSAGIVKPLLEAHPFAWLFFVVFILLSTFMVLNLFIGVVVTALEDEIDPRAIKEPRPSAVELRLLEEIASLRAEVAALRPTLRAAESGPDSSAALQAARG